MSELTPSIDGARCARELLAAAACAVLLLALVYVVAVQTAWGQRQDEDAVLGRYVSDAAHDDVDRLLATISVSSLAVIGGGIVLLALVRRRPHLALVAGAVIIGAVVTSQVLKFWILPRPDLIRPQFLPEQSFPSGHATVALALALALTLVVPRSIRTVVALGGLVYALAIGIGVVSAGWHRPSDVLGAYLVTFAWAAVACSLLVTRYGTGENWDARASTHDRESDRRATAGPLLFGTAILLLAVAALAAAAIVLEHRRGGFQRLGPGYEFALACLTIAALGVALVGALLWLLRGISLDAPRRPERSPRARAPVDV